MREIGLLGSQGQTDRGKAKKLEEVAGFCELILSYVREFLPKKDPLRVLDCSCGKSYLGLALVRLLEQLEGRQALLTGVDSNAVLIQKCRSVAAALGVDSARFFAARTLEFAPAQSFDLTVALHACDTATDEAIAKGILLDCYLILVVPCCQNQIRGQIKNGHPLSAMTEFGPIRYRLANLLTDSLRAQFLKGAGYHVEMREIGSPRLTPKNLCICARRSKRATKKRRVEGYRALRDLFKVKPRIESYCPGVAQPLGE